MERNIEQIKKSGKIWSRSDKSRSIYKISPSEYDRILNKITDNHKLDHNKTTAQINSDTAKFANKLRIKDSLGKLKEKCAYILFKDHKKNFQSKKLTSLVNPAKIELGLVSKDLIQNITSRILSNSRYDLWRNSLDTIDWLVNIKNKNSITFIQLDIIDFYPSITRELLLKSKNHTCEYTDICDEEIEILTACKKSILTDNWRTWVKKLMQTTWMYLLVLTTRPK